MQHKLTTPFVTEAADRFWLVAPANHWLTRLLARVAPARLLTIEACRVGTRCDTHVRIALGAKLNTRNVL